MSEWFIIESTDDKGQWYPVHGSGSSTREKANRFIESMQMMMPATTVCYRVARYVRDEDAL